MSIPDGAVAGIEEDQIPVVDMTPIGHYADGSPRYSFRCSFPRVQILDHVRSTKASAYEDGRQWIRNWEMADRMGNMGSVIGVTARGDGYSAVVNYFHSNT